MMIRQHGSAILLVTSVLLLAALVITLGSARQMFFLLKQANNHIKSRQQHWLAEGALECAMAQIQPLKVWPDILSDCLDGKGILPQVTSTATGFLVSANAGFAHLRKEIQIGGDLSAGALQSSADLYFHGSASFSTPDPGAVTEQGWQCVAIRYRDQLVTTGAENKGLSAITPPYTGFPEPGMPGYCAAGHQTRSSSGTDLGQDFVRDESVEPFSAFFGVQAGQYARIRDAGSFTVLHGSGLPVRVEACGSKVANLVEMGQRHIWVEGGCEIEPQAYARLVQASQMTDGIILLIHDGVFSLMSDASAATLPALKGVMFLVNHDYTPQLADWSGFEAASYLQHEPNDIAIEVRQRAAYFQHGAISVSGGQFFAATGQAAIFYTTLDFAYNRDTVDAIRRTHAKIVWREGSWYAR
ncbi:hypothetical protein [Vibrio proteolyticus]|uniref:Type 4 fimbrial biogenesis protein PilX N-terminal domain-containing protein n=1 Tax=Vibrio proteolyticus NBRC 13287 TaxID=1219065 RepID=U2ZLN3_VIBPR|nr:hypothetical protein [Vibrio proteolyticus]GAD68671.1 hypothetical protein VPR01S_18_00740 [Vibrio proteolyticus NBRC 13287]